MIIRKIKRQLSEKLTDYIYEKYKVEPVDNYQDREQWIQKELGKLPSGSRLLHAGVEVLEHFNKLACFGYNMVLTK